MPSEGRIEKLLVAQSDEFGITTRTVDVHEGLVDTGAYEARVARDELLAYLVSEGYISMKETIAKGATAPKPEVASRYGPRGDGKWLYAKSYSQLTWADKLDEYVSDQKPRRPLSTQIAVEIAEQPGWQRIPNLPLEKVSVDSRVVVLPIYETEFGEIVRLKDVSEISRSCDLSVEYSVEREPTEFGKAAPKLMKNFERTEERTGCLARYDDGWRLQK